MKTCIIFLIGVFCFWSSLSGQDKITDSLLTVLHTAKEDTARINTLNLISCEFKSNNPDTAIYFAKQALVLASKIEYKIGIADAYTWLGTAVSSLGKYDEALKELTIAKSI